MNKKEISLNDKFGQLILLGLDVYDINEEIINIIKDFHVGGVVLYKNNYTSIDTMIKFVNKIKEINKDNIPMFIAIDQENGRVNRFPKEIERIYNPLKQSQTKDLNVINEVNKITTYLLKNIGVNMNFAPVLDIYRSERNKAIGNRSYGEKIDDILKYGLPFMKEMQKNNIISVVKHFPGHGATNKDSHFILPKIKDVKSLEKEDIKVFNESIKNGADAIMVGHLVLKGFGNKPASINQKIINKYLNNYDGLLVTDDLRMNALRMFHNVRKNIIRSIEAGNNLIMVKYKKGDYKLYKKLFKLVNNCEIDVEKVDKSAKKILSFKEKYNINNKYIDNKIDIEKINNRIKLINEYIDKKIS